MALWHQFLQISADQTWSNILASQAAFPAVLLYSALLAYFSRRSRRNYLGFPELPRTKEAVAAPGEVTVVIPARNEELRITACLERLSGLEVVVVDDHSEDSTADLARAAGAQVLAAPALKVGAAGKPNALAEGARHTKTPWILFLDAGVMADRALATSLWDYARSRQICFVNALFQRRAETWLERAIQPWVEALRFLAVDPQRVNNPKDQSVPIGGSSLLARRDAYLFIGGHRSASNTAFDDVGLARRAKLHRMAIETVRAGSLGHVSRYPCFRDFWTGMQRTLLQAAAVAPYGTFWLVVAVLFCWTWWIPLVFLVAQAHWLSALTAALLPGLALKPWCGSWGRSLMATPGLVGLQMVSAAALMRRIYGFGVLWKGRSVPI